MAVVNPATPPGPREPAANERLESWKEIAAYLKRDESTVRRWEEEGLPVHRLAHKKKATVYAYKRELDVWRSAGQVRRDAVTTSTPTGTRTRLRWAVAAAALLLAFALALKVAERQRGVGVPRPGEIASIAVLPMKNLSGDSGQDYFADGMTEALITELGKISALQVLSHQTVNGYRQTQKPIPEIARELKVDSVLEGTVLHSGSRVRITTNLVQAVPERHLWAESYEFERQDVLALQSEVARDVASRIRIKVTPQEQARFARSRHVDPDAYEAYLLGRAYLFKAPTRAKEYFEKATEKDPDYAPAYASLAEVFLRTRFSPPTPTEHRVQSRRWAAKALQLDDTLAEAHNALARAWQQEWDWAAAEREYRRAIELNPNYSVARIWYCMYLNAMQRFDEAIVQARHAQQLDPASPLVNTWAASTYLYAGLTDEGMAAVQRALELDPTDSNASLVVARTYVTHAQYAEAIAELQRAISLKKERDPLLLGALAHAYARGGEPEQARKLVDELTRAGTGPTPFGLAWAHAGLGNSDQAFASLERAYTERRDRIAWLNVDPLLNPLRSDPRFDDLVRRVGLPINPRRSR